MKQQPTKTESRRSEKELRSLAEWEITRAKGKARYVLHQALKFSLIMIPLRDFSDYILDGRMQPSDFWTGAITYFAAGLFLGVFGWATMEAKYTSFCLRYRRAAAEINPRPLGL